MTIDQPHDHYDHCQITGLLLGVKGQGQGSYIEYGL